MKTQLKKLWRDLVADPENKILQEKVIREEIRTNQLLLECYAPTGLTHAARPAFPRLGRWICNPYRLGANIYRGSAKFVSCNECREKLSLPPRKKKKYQ